MNQGDDTDLRWEYAPENEPPPDQWWNEPGALIAVAAGAISVVVGIVAIIVFTDESIAFVVAGFGGLGGLLVVALLLGALLESRAVGAIATWVVRHWEAIVVGVLIQAIAGLILHFID